LVDEFLTAQYKLLLLILLVIVPLLIAGPICDTALAYQQKAMRLQTYVFEKLGPGALSADYSVSLLLSVVKRDFSDERLQMNFEASVSSKSNSTPQVVWASQDPITETWWSSGALAYREREVNDTITCEYVAEQERCVHYPFINLAQFGSLDFTAWEEFGVLNGPMDEYSTGENYVWFDHPFDLDNMNLTYSLLSGYRAGIEDYRLTAKADLPPTVAARLPIGVNQTLSFRIAIMREPSTFLPLVLYATTPLLILYYVGVITMTTVGRREDRLKVYVGALFASFAYWLNLRSLLQTPITWIEILAMILMVVWIVLEAGTIMFQGKTVPG
jgi:hypothetical protein